MSEKREKIVKLLKRQTAKKESYFRRLQTLYDLIPSLDDERNQHNFITSARTLNRKEFEAILDDINDYELDIDEQFVPNYEPLAVFDTLYGSILIALEKIYAEHPAKISNDNKTAASSDKGDTTCDYHHKRHNLPPVEIKKYSGDIKDWVRFRDLFTSIIINNPRLTGVEKLHYLITSVTDRPADIIKTFSLSDENFDLAWTSLKDRYESDRVLAAHYFEELIKPAVVPAKPSIEHLQGFLSKINDNTVGLKNMKLADLSDFLLFSLAIRQLDPVTRKEFESKHGAQAIPTFDSLITFIKSECRILEITASISPAPPHSVIRKTSYEPPRKPVTHRNSGNKIVFATQPDLSVKTSTFESSKSPSNVLSCPSCNATHQLYHCPKYIELNISDRHAFVKKLGLCYNCLGNHRVSSCRSTRTCHCNRRHHSTLHFDSIRIPASSTSSSNSCVPQSSSKAIPHKPATSSTSPTLTTFNSISIPGRTSAVLLGTARAMIKNSKGNFVRFRLLVDCASTATFITKELVEVLGLNVIPYTQQFSGLSDSPVGFSTGFVECVIKPAPTTHPKITAHALIVENILKNVPQVSLPVHCTQYLKGLQLADPEFYRAEPVDMLIGCDILPKILVPGPVTCPNNNVGVLNTIFGHIIFGSLPIVEPDILPLSPNVSLLTFLDHSATKSSDEELHDLVKSFWDVENISTSVSNPDDDFCEQHFIKTHRRDSAGRYIVQMPFKCDPDSLVFPESRDVAEQRFYSLEARFKRNEILKNDCVKFLREYENLGHMKKATQPGKYFIPYFCVFNPNSITTPTRVVFDGSAKRSGVSVNDVLFPGPKLQHDVPDVMMNLRIDPLVFFCDISKMYRQILLEENQRCYVHILFREDPSKPLEEYELCTLVYGLAPSSFLAHRCLLQVCHDAGEKYPLAVNVISCNSVVDDMFGGAKTLKELHEIKTQLISLLSSGGFPLNKWLSNSPEFLNELKTSDPSGNLVIRSPDDTTIKILGIGWNPLQDVFFFSIDPPPITPKFTKRNVLSVIARIYDPLGFAAPTIFLFKSLLKDIWLSGVGWDESIPPSLATQWAQFLIELPELRSIKIPRCVFPHEPTAVQVLGFCDGSMKGSAAVLYLRVQFIDTVKIFLLKSKTRIAPTKLQTIPRLELLGALLLAKLLNSIQAFLVKIPVKSYSIYLFCDSTIVLSWLKKPAHLLKLFVANRITSILDHTSDHQWHHISTDNNIADIASRGITPHALISHSSWFEGPDWAYTPIETWPISSFDPLDNLPEIKPAVILTTAAKCPQPDIPEWLLKFSNLGKLQRVLAYVLRFISNTRFPQKRCFGPLSISELKMALNVGVRCDQHHYFYKELSQLNSNQICSPKLQSLSPFIDTTGLIRVGGRLFNSSLPFDVKHPILLSNISPFTTLIISHYHQFYLHSGTRTLQGILSRQFWIINSRQVIRKVIHKCVRCARFRCLTATPPMGNLPAARVTPSRPFLHCAVDLAGPYLLKESLRRNSRIYKGYFALFVCFSVKAVHIEVLTSLSAECFIAALHRFVSRRGLPAHLYSDQATNFRGAARQLSEVTAFLRDSGTTEILRKYVSSQGITFHLNVPRAPHMNGIAESNIKNTKFHLTRVIGTQTLTLEEFSTITARIEGILNSRPLCALSDSPDELQSLTPGHFLVGTALIALPEDNLEEIPLNRLSRWQLVSQITRSLWRRWEQEYVHTLQNRSKWFKPATNINEGQLVWLKEDGSPPLSYPLGRIAAVHPGKDGVVRAVTVRTSSGTYRRPTRKIAPLPIS